MEANRLWLVRAYTLCTLFAGISATLLLGAWISDAEQREREAIFRQEAGERVDALAHGVENATHALETVNQLFATLGNVSQAQFAVFTQPILEQYPYILSFAYQRYRANAPANAYEISMAQSFKDFGTTSFHKERRARATERNQQRIVEYISPLHGNEQLPGTIAPSVPEVEEAVLRSLETGAITSTRLIPLVKDDPHRLGFTLLKPVVRHPSGDVPRGSHGKPDVRGFTMAMVNASDLAYRILEKGGFLSDPTFTLEIFTGDVRNENRIFSQPATAASVERPADSNNEVRQIDVAGTPWTVIVSASSNWKEAAPASRLTYLFGFILAGLLSLFVYQMLHRSGALKSAVEALKHDAMLRQSAEAELRQLAAHQLRVREDERKHMAREIHDDLGQNLLVLRMDVGAFSHDIAKKCPDAEAKMGLLLKHIDATIKSAREIINHLRPSVLDLGTFDALQWLTGHMNKLGKVRFTLECQDESAFDGLKEDDAISLFRAVQEAMTNVVRHANATNCVVRVQHDGARLCIEVSDNGSGQFPNDKRRPRSFGLIGIRERITAMGGEMSIVTGEGKGTTIQFAIPAPPDRPTPAVLQTLPSAEKDNFFNL